LRVAHICGRKSNLEKELLDSNLHKTSLEVGISTAKAPVANDTKTKETKQRARFAEQFLSL
jgi:hypothetical protein